MITIGLVTFNRRKYLSECVKSILAQTFQEWRLIISNDYILEEVTFETLGIPPDNRILIINQEINLGELKNLNFLLGCAKTKYFTWLCDDDVFNAHFFKCAVTAFDFFGSDNLVAFYSNYETGTNYDNNKSIVNEGFLSTLHSFENSQFVQRYLLKQLPLIGCYGVIKTELLRNIGGFKFLGNSFSPYSDTLLPISLIQYGPIAYSDVPLVFLRTHQTSMSFTSSDFKGYTTAEDDFISELELISKRNSNTIDLQECIGLSYIWFSDNHFTVLMRGRTGGTIKVYLKYLYHQFTASLPRLKFYWKLRLLIHIFNFCLHNFINSIGRRVLLFFKILINKLL